VTRKFASAVLTALLASPLAAQPDEARPQLIGYLDGLAQTQLAARRGAVARISNRADFEKRQAAVREKLLRLIGGLPQRSPEFGVKRFAMHAGDGFSVENIAFESQPGFWVTANVYVPAGGGGRFPAVVLAPGHGAGGKLELWNWGANLARNGIVALGYDPIGQGERLQYYDAERKASRIGNPTGEHGEANVPPLLIGETVARYMVNDAMRAVDYLSGRTDVDASRIGAFGCSGGGTATAYLAALDPRIQAAGTACYITSFEELLGSATGVQEAEQSLPHFLAEGLDFADWVEAFAPKPYAIISTRDDMFPFAGAQQSFEEARRIYGLYDAEARIQWITGPGGHGNLGPISADILKFLVKSLKGDSAEPAYTPMRLEHREDLQVTPTGQVATSLGGETVYSLNRKRAEAVMAPPAHAERRSELDALREQIRRDIRDLTAAEVNPGDAPPKVRVLTTDQRAGYRVETISMESEGAARISGLVALPDANGAHPAVLLLGAAENDAAGDLGRLAQSGHVVMAIGMQPAPAGNESVKSPYLGNLNLLALRSFLVDRPLIGLRIDDTLRALNWLAAQPGVNRAAITVYGRGAAGMVALHAAALDGRTARTVVEESLVSYRMIVDRPLHRGVSESLIPGVLRKYDTGDLLLASYPRPVMILSPRDAAGELVSPEQCRQALPQVFESDARLGAADRVRMRVRSADGSLPLD
jgi:cephalosporin-C deacetylase-like acetyl esterase